MAIRAFDVEPEAGREAVVYHDLNSMDLLANIWQGGFLVSGITVEIIDENRVLLRGINRRVRLVLGTPELGAQ